MLKTKKSVVYVVVFILLMSCVSFEPPNLGIYNPENVNEEELVTLHISPNSYIYQVNNVKVDWWRKQYKDLFQVVRIASGMHTFHVNYESEIGYTMPRPIVGEFEKGNEYILKWAMKYEDNKTHVTFHIYQYNNNEIGEEVTVEPSNPEN